MLEILFLALALSADCFSAGVSYGLKRLILPWYGTLIIGGCSGLVLFLSMILGGWLSGFLPVRLTGFLGAGMLIALGLYLAGNGLRELADADSGEAPLFQWEIARFGIIVQILKEPHQADLDRSGRINSKEALWLGAALSLDSFAAGISMAFLGYSPLKTSFCVMLGTCVCLRLGLYAGENAGEKLSGRYRTVMPGCLMVLIGLIRLFF